MRQKKCTIQSFLQAKGINGIRNRFGCSLTLGKMIGSEPVRK